MKSAYLLEDNGDFIVIAEVGNSGAYTDTRYVHVVQRNQDYVVISDGGYTEDIHLINDNSISNSNSTSISSSISNSSSTSSSSSSSSGGSTEGLFHGCGCILIVIIVIIIQGVLGVLLSFSLGPIIEQINQWFRQL